jgi:hypothetical protein
MKSLLKYVNSIPFPFMMKHYYVFDTKGDTLKNNELNSPESWDTLRNNDPHFSISENREEWLLSSRGLVRKDGQDGAMSRRAHEVVKIVDQLSLHTLFSVGVGGAGLEYQIKFLRPALKLICSEYAEGSVGLLKKVFCEADSIITFDIKAGDWSKALQGIKLTDTLVLMYRIDINFNNEEMSQIFRKMYDAKIENIFIVLCGTLTIRGIFNRLKQRFSWRLNSTRYLFAGYLRSKKSAEDFWRGLYSCEEQTLEGLPAFLLKRLN